MNRSSAISHGLVRDETAGGDLNFQDEPFAATVAIIQSYLLNNQHPAEKLPELIKQVNGALREVHDEPRQTKGAPDPLLVPNPAVPVESSVERDHIVCLEDGRRIRLLKRHLASTYGMTPEQYRRKWNLPDDYPMVAPSLSEHRARIAGETKPHLKRKKNRKPVRH